MAKTLFFVICTSCHAKLDVRNPALVGQIVACPKCHCMVLIEPPIETNETVPVDLNDIVNDVVTDNTTAPTPHDTHKQPDKKPSNDEINIHNKKNNNDVVDLSDCCDSCDDGDTQLATSENWKSHQTNNHYWFIPVIAISSAVVLLLTIVIVLLMLWRHHDANPTDTKTMLPHAVNALTVSPSASPNHTDSMSKNDVSLVTDQKNTLPPSVSTDTTETKPITTSTTVATTPNGEASPGNTTSVSSTENAENNINTTNETDADNTVDAQNMDITNADMATKGNANLTDERQGQKPLLRNPRQKIDIDARLTLPVRSIQFDKTPIIIAIRTLSDLTNIPMQLDVDELRARGISVETPITLQVSETTVAGVIDAILEKTYLAANKKNDVIIFGYTNEQLAAVRTIRYDLTVLATLEKDPISPQQVADWVTQLFLEQPNNPQVTNAAVLVDGNIMAVNGTSWLQDQVNRFQLSLHYMREIEPETKLTPDCIAPEAFGWERVNTPLTFNLVEPVPLQHALRLIENHAKIRLLIDYDALYDEGFSSLTPVSAHVNNGTIDKVLCALLEPHGLTYRIIEKNTVEITTPQTARNKMSVETQHYHLIAGDKTPESIANTVEQVFNNGRWQMPGGGMIIIDHASEYMLIRQSQPLQREIRQWLGEMQHESGESGDAP